MSCLNMSFGITSKVKALATHWTGEATIWIRHHKALDVIIQAWKIVGSWVIGGDKAARYRMYVYFTTQSGRHNIQFLAPLSVIPCFNRLCVAKLCLVLCRLPLGPAIQPSTSQLKPIVEQCLDSMCLLMSSLLIEVLAQRQHIHPWAGAALVVLASMKASSESRSQKNFWPGIAMLYLTPKHLSEDRKTEIQN